MAREEITGGVSVAWSAIKTKLNNMFTECYSLSSAHSSLTRKKRYPGAVSIVFDDGLAGNYTHAYPLLKKYNLSATFAISAGKVDLSTYMTTVQIQEINSGGLVELADHEYNHATMTSMTEQEIKDSVALSRAWFLSTIGKLPTSFVYPGGYRNNLIDNVLYPLYSRARGTGNAVQVPVMNGGVTPWLFPWVGWDTAWFADIAAYISYVRKLVLRGFHIICTFHNVGDTTSASVVSATDLETFLVALLNENIEVVRFDGIHKKHNFVPDGSFEDMPAGGLIENITPPNNGNIGAAWGKDGGSTYIVIDDTVARRGSKSLKFTREFGDGLAQHNAVGFAPAFDNEATRFSFWHKGSNSTGCKVTYNVGAYGENGVSLGSAGAYTIATVNTSWQLWSYNMTQKVGVMYYIISLSMPEPVEGQVGPRSVWIDDVCLNNIGMAKINEVMT